jgi:hypothetical protein
MATVYQVYIDRGNVESVLLEKRPRGETVFETVDDDTVLRAVFRFGSYCLDTDTDVAGNIELAENATVVNMKLGLISGLVAGQYDGYLTIYDALNPNGLGWGDMVLVNVQAWSICP